ncbi:NTE family protein [Hasllibacter halocynthiae]|uniref:NTE family protein n=1 Tax=Hasllibacter halocynthiae TaxID=595589 RepID=A0A2T0X891_9RHOB|nr:patatin-like phospholipase family protein [Hasllibacter halocynthiae]PRY95149.1 NTE family protein [Hasllibacter halocynthiae]
MAEGVRVNLALQGGGAHGAFTWGALDRLLGEEDVEIAGISGTSAGALNGAALKAGLIESRDAARRNLAWFWGEVARVGDLRLANWMTHFLPDAGNLARFLELTPGYRAMDAATRVFSPYGYGPFYDNPLRPIAERLSYDRVRAAEGPAFFVNATNVRTGKVRVFPAEEVTPDVLLASACLPTLFQAVEIEGDAYWDGGYTGNPALFPLFGPDLPADVIVININPLVRPEVPRSAQAIQNRINEIGFNTSLLRELRAIAFVQRLLAQRQVPQGSMKEVLVHMIADDDLMRRLNVATKLVPTRAVIETLRAAGEAAMDSFLASHKGDIGRRGTVDLQAMFG